MDVSSMKGFEQIISLLKLWTLFFFLTAASLEKPINEVRKMENPGTKPTNAETRDGEGVKPTNAETEKSFRKNWNIPINVRQV